MDDDYRELAHRLLAAATAMLENAIEAAVAGQSAKLSAPGHSPTARVSFMPRHGISRSSPKRP